MSSKSTVFLVLSIVAVTVFAAWRYYSAEMLAWDLQNRVPTARVSDSKNFGIYVAEVAFKPEEIDLGGERYRIEKIWVEHRTEPDRVGPFFTRQKIFPELILCAEVKSAKAGTTPTPTRVGIKDANIGKILFSGARDVLFAEVGLSIPPSLVLYSLSSRDEAKIYLAEAAK